MASSLAEIIPQVAYDIIGRIVPGIVIIFSWEITRLGPTDAWDEYLVNTNLTFTTWTFLLFVATAYVISIALGGIWYIVEFLLAKIGICKDRTSIYLQYDAIKIHSPETGARLLKLKAERNAAQVLAVGWTVAGIGDLWLLQSGPYSQERYILLTIWTIAFIGACGFRIYIQKRFENNLYHHWVIFRKDLQCLIKPRTLYENLDQKMEDLNKP